MPSQTASLSLAAVLRQRRDRLAEMHPRPVVLWSGQAVSRNFPANTYPFRANSHFLYFAGLPLANAAIHLAGGRLTLFMDDTSPEAALWHGPSPSREAIATDIGADAAYPFQDLNSYLAEAATLPAQTTANSPRSRVLLEALVALRLHHDDYALDQIKQAAAVSVAAHKAGMAATPGATAEAQVRAAMEQVIIAQGMTCAYNSIVTVHGEVLHNEQYHHALAPGDLLLADVGAEAPSGWASDITRTWPVSGQFTAPQRDLYDLVLAAHDACIAAARPGTEYRNLHLLACRTLAAGLVDLGVLKGDPDTLVERDVHALFFPHGVGHLLGLDVHDMEDLGDVAGYAPGRCRSDRFGLKFLRLDRPLAANMVVTIEPGFYQVPGILDPARRSGQYDDVINWERLKAFDGVRGIRIENDVHINSTGCTVLTAALPTHANAVEALVSGA
ncbi:MAG: Xaa-Pro aminopeptidase [Leptolyngbya sp.]|nr:MAG: Xaa-Pro aminopeptidase [Leptolyngbya sp.]